MIEIHIFRPKTHRAFLLFLPNPVKWLNVTLRIQRGNRKEVYRP